MKPNSKVKGFIARQKEDMKAVREMMDYAKELLTEATHPTPTISEIKKKEYCITQIYKTGEKVAGIWNEKGRKPVGYNVYISGIFRIFLPYLTAGSKRRGK
jgi:hypothetical protein